MFGWPGATMSPSHLTASPPEQGGTRTRSEACVPRCRSHPRIARHPKFAHPQASGDFSMAGTHDVRLHGSQIDFGNLAGLVGTWTGANGFNMIAVPDQQGEFTLLVDSYTETMVVNEVPATTPQSRLYDDREHPDPAIFDDHLGNAERQP